MRKMILIFFGLSLACFGSTSYTTVTYKEAKRIYTAGSGLFVDARGLKFYKKGTILGAISMPIDRFNRLKRLLPANKGSKLVLFCNGIKCNKSVNLAEKIVKLGYSRVLVFREGYPKWHEMGQDIMLSSKYCKASSNPKKEITIQGVKVELGHDEGMIDSAWFIEKFNKKVLPRDIALIDVRKEKDFLEGHLPGAINVKWDSDKGIIDISRFPKDKLILFYCNTGLLSSDAYDSLDGKIAKHVLFLNALVKCKGEECVIRSLDR